MEVVMYIHPEDKRGARPTVLAKWIWFIVVAAIACSFYYSNVLADEVFRDKDHQGMEAALRITDKPCSDKGVLAWLHERFLDDRRFKASVLTWKGADWQSCYVEKDEQVYSIDSEGSPFQPVPRSMFKDEAV